MKLSLLALATAVGSACAYRLPGFDISGWQPKVDFAAARKDGARFVIIKVRIYSIHYTAWPWDFTLTSIAGHRRDNLQESRLLRPMDRCQQARLCPWILPLRTAQHFLRSRPG